MSRHIFENPARDRSPQPVRQPSPDIATGNVITSTKSPSSLNSSLPSFNTPKKSQIPLLEQVTALRQQNQHLKDQLRGSHSPPPDVPQLRRLQAQLRQKDQQLQYLRSSQKITSSKKISLTVNESTQIRELGDKIRELREENRRLKEQGEQGQGEGVRGLVRRVRELELENQELKRQAGSRRIKTLPGDLGDERNRLYEERVKFQMEKIKMEVNLMIEKWYQDMTWKVDNLEHKLVDVTRRHAMLLAQHRKRQQGSTAHKQSSGYKPDPFTPQKSQLPPQPPSPQSKLQLSQLQSQLSQSNTTIQKLTSQLDQLTGDNRRLQDQIGHLGMQLTRYKNRPPAPTVTTSSVSMIELAETVRRLERENQGLRRKVEEKGNGKEVELLRGQLGALNGALEMKNREINQLRSEIYKRDAVIDDRCREIANLKSQLTIINVGSSVKTVAPDQTQQVAALNKLIKDQSSRYDSIQIEKNQQIIRLQNDNKTLLENLDKLQKSQSELIHQLEISRQGKNTEQRQLLELKNDVTRLSNQNRRIVSQLQQTSFLRNQVSRLKDQNHRLLSKSSSSTTDLQRQLLQLRTANSDLSLRLAQSTEQLLQQRQRQSTNDLQYDRLRSSHTRLVNELAHLNKISPEVDKVRQELEKTRQECAMLRGLLEENERTVNQLRMEKEQILRGAGEEGRKVIELTSMLRGKEQELIRLLENKKVTAIEAYLRDLNDLRVELQSLDLEPLQAQIHDRNQRLRSLLTQKISQIRVVNKYLQDINALVRQNALLRKDALNAQSKFISQKQQNEKLRNWIESQQRQKESLEREIIDLKNIINEYINKEVVFEEVGQNQEMQKEMRMLEEEIRVTTSEQQRTVIDVSKIKANFRQAIIKLDSISSKIRQELAQGLPS